MIRERQLNTITFSSGNVSLVDLPRDAVFHTLQLSVFGATWTSVQGGSGTGPALAPGFPFNIMRQIRLLRNGSDVVWSGSGEQLAKEHFYLNRAYPMARIYTTSTNVETLRTVTSRGITVPANSEGIGSNIGAFTLPDAPSATTSVSFDMQVEMWFQNASDDAFYSTLIDARKLATFQLEITWATEAALVSTAGTANTSNAISASVSVLSLDQDNLDVSNDFGTFKRSQLSYSNFAYGSSNNQILLPRGNFYHGIIWSTKAYKTGSTTVPVAENTVLTTLDNRINSNFSLRRVNFNQLQSKNQADFGGRQQAWDTAQGGPQGWAYTSYISAMAMASELVPTYSMDQFDVQVSLSALASATNGVTTAATLPLVDLLIEEIIPGVSISKNAPQGSQAGSAGSGTSAKPYAR